MIGLFLAIILYMAVVILTVTVWADWALWERYAILIGLPLFVVNLPHLWVVVT